jgi:hypothetical protein
VADGGLTRKLNVKQILIYLTIALRRGDHLERPTTTGNSVGSFLGAFGLAVRRRRSGASFLKARS